jgi:hypothetical protein
MDANSPRAMKLLFFLFLQGAIAISSVGQQILISLPTHSARWPYENLYEIQAIGLPCAKIVVKTDQGQIIQNGCRLFYRPDSAGYAVFRAYQKTAHGMHLVDTALIAVRFNERLYPQLGIHIGGPISKSEVLEIGGLLLKEFVNDDHAEAIHLISYRIIILQGDSTWSIRNIGARFSAGSLTRLMALQPNDKLIIADIEASDYKRSSFSVRPAEFTIQ